MKQDKKENDTWCEQFSDLQQLLSTFCQHFASIFKAIVGNFQLSTFSINPVRLPGLEALNMLRLKFYLKLYKTTIPNNEISMTLTHKKLFTKLG